MKYTQASRVQQLVLYGVAAVVLVLDQASKWWIEANLPIGGVLYPFPSIGQYFNILHTYNLGAAFGTFLGMGWVFTLVSVLVVGFIVYFNTQLPAEGRLARVALGLMAGGAMGNNWFDRLRLGHVTDFVNINLRPLVANTPRLDFAILDWPVFNVADLAIVSGVVIMAVLMWQEDPLPVAAPPAAVPPPPPVYNFNQLGWSQSPPLPAPPPVPPNDLARFAWRGALVWVALVGVSLWVAGRVLWRKRPHK